MDRATPAPGTQLQISPITMIATCEICDADLVRVPAQDMHSAYPWYHIRTGRILCRVGIYPSQVPVAQIASNL